MARRLFSSPYYWGGLLGAILAILSPPAATQQMRLSNIADLPLGRWSGVGDLTRDDDLCVYMSPPGRYRVTATGSGTAGAFWLSNGNSVLPYAARWNDAKGPGGSLLTAGVPLTNQSGANSQRDDCSLGGLTANISITITTSALFAATAGRYSGTLTLLIGPD